MGNADTCGTCKWHRQKRGIFGKSHRCTHKAAITFDPITGRINRPSSSCKWMRGLETPLYRYSLGPVPPRMILLEALLRKQRPCFAGKLWEKAGVIVLQQDKRDF